ncbi:MAG TPA: hypothetical protein VGM44_08745 [Polyangiaceae bacterium]|jgi:hypothetical protein
MRAIQPFASQAVVALLGASFAFSACHEKNGAKADSKAATGANFTSGMLDYLKARGDLCLGKQFPLDVTEREQQSGARDALQMPVLERAGLLTSSDATGSVQTEDGPVPTKVRRYQLSETGKLYYLSRPVPGQTDANGAPVMRSDLCAVKLSLDQVVGFELAPPAPAKSTNAIVTYTYQIEPAPWMSIPEVQSVFPAAMHVILGAGSAQLKEGFTLTESGWVANELVPSAPAVAKGTAPIANR